MYSLWGSEDDDLRQRERISMTERKPPGMSFTSWIDQQINEATERGLFDNLPGAGKPLPDREKRILARPGCEIMYAGREFPAKSSCQLR